ncbi:hypothetical protein GJ744_008304 [Endocarpon pusillum]|uniref:Uncharacterized protein n=1 Tax=Endocarpon pusillum TaxID=364733 RepID=A0A8H7E3J7_9EURO|nr:hypothetical protein GJ744_008304 [Endocarpon pusillum]
MADDDGLRDRIEERKNDVHIGTGSLSSGLDFPADTGIGQQEQIASDRLVDVG